MAFVPTDITNLAIWLDASDATTITHDTGAVSQWDDKSANAYAFTQADSARQPTTGTTSQNSLNTLDFAADFLQESTGSLSAFNFLHNGTKHAVFMVVKAGNVTDPAVFYPLLATQRGTNSDIGGILYYEDRSAATAIDQIRHVVANGTNYIIRNFSADDFWPANEYALLTAKVDPATTVSGAERSRMQRNGDNEQANNISSATTPTASDASYSLRIFNQGTTTYGTGQLAEMVVYDRELTTAEVEDVEGYLAAKWGITLPGHSLTLTPDGTVSSSGIEDQAAGTTDLHLAIDDSPDDSDGDTTYLVNSGSASGHAWVTLSNTPSDFGEMLTLGVRVRARQA